MCYAGGAESSVTPPISEEVGELEEVEEGQDPEEDSGRYMGILVQALSRLGRVNEALEVGRLLHAAIGRPSTILLGTARALSINCLHFHVCQHPNISLSCITIASTFL